MKKLLLISFVLLLTGCGEKFDASSDNMIAVSYNGILKTLDGEEKERFIQQYRFYTEVYEGPESPDDPGFNMQQNDIESLHGLSYSAVIDRVEEHEAYVKSIKRDNDLSLLRSLHKEYLKTRENILLAGKVSPVTVEAARDRYNNITGVKIDVENNSELAAIAFDLNLRATLRSTGEDVFSNTSKVDNSDDPLLPGYVQTFRIQHDELEAYLDDKSYSVQGSIANVKTTDGRLTHSIMNDAAFVKYASLMEQYPEEFETIQDELGRPII